MKPSMQWLLILFFALPALGQEKGWEKQWDETLAAARKEGKVVVMGSADPVLRKELPEKFHARFGVAVEYLGGRGGDNFARLRMERRAGVYTTDAVMAGMSNMVDYYNEKFLEPLSPALILPEVLDGSKWKKGKLWFMDPEGKYILRLYNYTSGGLVFINTKHAKAEEFKSIRDILHPRWKEKISVYDPTVSGTGEIDAARFYMRFGEDFVRKLYIDQKPAISRNKRQLADWLAHGTYPLSLGLENEAAIRMKEEGLPVDVFSLPDSPATLSAGNGLLALMNKAAHPNAARLFVNWIASKEGLEVLGRARQKPITRNDIDESYALPWEIPKPGVNYFDTYDWGFTISMREKLGDFIKQLLKR
jgi:iron(III) transport system substrate-binding protein